MKIFSDMKTPGKYNILTLSQNNFIKLIFLKTELQHLFIFFYFLMTFSLFFQTSETHSNNINFHKYKTSQAAILFLLQWHDVTQTHSCLNNDKIQSACETVKHCLIVHS